VSFIVLDTDVASAILRQRAESTPDRFRINHTVLGAIC
jgi:hypothetical protein